MEQFAQVIVGLSIIAGIGVGVMSIGTLVNAAAEGVTWAIVTLVAIMYTLFIVGVTWAFTYLALANYDLTTSQDVVGCKYETTSQIDAIP